MASVLNDSNLTLREIDQICYESKIRIVEHAPRGTVIKSIHCEFLSDGSLWIKAKTSKGCRKTWMRKEEVISIIGWSYMYRPWTTTNHDLKKEITCESTFPGPRARVFVKINHNSQAGKLPQLSKVASILAGIEKTPSIVIRDILHQHFPESKNKTSLACQW